MSLYNIKSSDDHFIITKFDDDLNVESSYEFHNGPEGFICHCPAGQRPSCRHRQMYPQLVTRVDTIFMLDFDTRQWVSPVGEVASAASSSTFELPKPTEDQREYLQKIQDHADRPVDLSVRVGEPSRPPYNRPQEGASISDPIVHLDDSHPFRRRL